MACIARILLLVACLLWIVGDTECSIAEKRVESTLSFKILSSGPSSRLELAPAPRGGQRMLMQAGAKSDNAEDKDGDGDAGKDEDKAGDGDPDGTTDVAGLFTFAEALTQTDFHVDVSFTAKGPGLGSTGALQWRKIISQASSTPSEKVQIEDVYSNDRRQASSEINVEATLFTDTENGAKNLAERMSSTDFVQEKIKIAVSNVLDVEAESVTDIEATAFKVSNFGNDQDLEENAAPPATNGFKSVYLAGLAVLIVPLAALFVCYRQRSRNTPPPLVSSGTAAMAPVKPPAVNPSYGGYGAPSAPPQPGMPATPTAPSYVSSGQGSVTRPGQMW